MFLSVFIFLPRIDNVFIFTTTSDYLIMKKYANKNYSYDWPELPLLLEKWCIPRAPIYHFTMVPLLGCYALLFLLVKNV